MKVTATGGPEDDVWLKAGEGYMVERSRYEKHLEMAPNIKEVIFYFFTIFDITDQQLRLLHAMNTML